MLAFGRQKRLLLGVAAFLAPLPLPLNESLGWGFLLAYLLGVGYFLWRANADRGEWMAPWAMNLLGLAYLPLFFLDLTTFSRGRVVGPVLHIGLFAILIKLFALRRERDKWQALMGIFFVFLAAMATSVHPSVVLYLAAFLGVGVLVLMRFAFFHILAGFGHRDAAAARVPLGGFLAACLLASVVLAVPLFAALPRVSSPYISGGVGGGSSELQSTGFSDEVTLDSIGRIRQSRAVAMRVFFEGESRVREDSRRRFKGATFELYDGRSWQRSPSRSRIADEGLDLIRLVPGQVERWAEVFLYPLSSRSLPLPTDTRLLRVHRYGLERGAGGGFYLGFPPRDTLRYEVGLGETTLSAAAPPDPVLSVSDGVSGDTPLPATLDLSGVSERMASLARQVMGEGDDADRVRRLERYLTENYDYTLDFVGRSIEHPLDDFLFRYKSGHCEYFASSLVLMLRSQGVHARLVTGFLGAEHNPLQGSYVVRQANAHAWVEAYLPGEGWVELDPTPPAGRPTGERQSFLRLASQAWDTVVFRWDRYVLTYGFNDQLALFGSLRGLWRQLFARSDPASNPSFQPADPEADGPTADTPPASAPAVGPGTVAALLFLVAVVAFIWWRHRRGEATATTAYLRLRNELRRSGVEVPDSLAPLALERRAAGRSAEAAAPAGRVVRLYLGEAFAGRPLADGDRERLELALREVSEALRKAS